MRKMLILAGLMLMASLTNAHAEADPNFYIYLCFGQSNMEGNATPEAIDKEYVDPRFQMLACVDFNNPARTKGQWYTAYPPIVRQGTGLGMADYFGRTMVANLPENVKVGVVDVAIGGTKIEGFISEEVADYVKNEADWFKNYMAAYDNDPYKRLVEMAKIAQQTGVIKGILLHQGESNNTQKDWPQKVKKIYDRLIKDLGLNATDIPLFVGEMVSQAAGGTCWGHNSIIATVPEVIPNSYVISSEGCPAKKEADGAIFHFTAKGYRIMGQRYAKVALWLLGVNAKIDKPDPITSRKWTIDQRLTSLSELIGKSFAIVNEADGKALYGTDYEDLAYDNTATAFDDNNSGYLFKIGRMGSGRSLRLVTPEGDVFKVYGQEGYLNSQAETGDCSFLLGLNNQRGYDIPDGAVWTPSYEEGKGWSLRNGGTGKYLKDATPAKYDEPTYFTFCTLKEASSTGITTIHSADGTYDGNVYDLNGRRVNDSNLSPGIYIKDRKKVIIK